MTAQNFTVDNGITVNGTGGNITGATNIVASGNLTVHDATIGGNINGAGGLDIDGEGRIGGNLVIVGNIDFSGGGSINQITAAYGNFYGAANGVGALYAGVPLYTPVPGSIAQFTGDSNEYLQINAQNISHGNTASMEYVLTADDGTDSTNYLDMGIASSTWDGTQTNSLGDAVAARDAWVYVQGGSAGGNLILGTTTAGYGVKVNAGGPGSANTVAEFTSTGLSLTGSIAATNIGNIAVINLNGNASTVLYGNGVFAAAAGSNYSDSNVVTLLSSFGSNVLSTTGNITGGNLTISGVTSLTGNITSSGYFISGNQATGGFKLGNVNSRITAGGSNAYATFGQNIALYPDTGLSALAGILIGGSGYLLAPNGARVLTLGGTGDIAVNGNINQTLASTQYFNTSGQVSAAGNVTAGNVITGGNIYTNTNGGGLLSSTLTTSTYNIYTQNQSTGQSKTINIGTGALLSTSTTAINLGTQYGNSNTTVYGNLVAANNASFSNVATITTSNYQIGYRDIPQIAFSANATAALTDAGKHYYSTTAGNLSLTIPLNASVAFPTGTAISIVVQAAGNILVNATSGVSLFMAGNSISGNRVVGTYGMATLMKVASDTWFINGTGVS